MKKIWTVLRRHPRFIPQSRWPSDWGVELNVCVDSDEIDVDIGLLCFHVQIYYKWKWLRP